MKTPIHGILFDLDGTLLNTAPDLIFALNKLREDEHLPPLPIEVLKSSINLGTKGMLKQALQIDETHIQFTKMRERFLELYLAHIADNTAFFPNIEKVLAYLEKYNIPWGIVTNKYTKYTLSLLKALHLDLRPACIVCGDTLSTLKPHPATLLHASKLIKQNPANCLFIGDAATDVLASNNAGTQSLVALYGYIDDKDQPHTWQATGFINDPIEILEWL